MWCMTMAATVLFTYNAVSIFRAFRYFFYIFVTWIAQLGCLSLKHLRIICSVSIVAADAVIFRWLVNKFKFFQLVFCYYMTGKAKLSRF